MTNNDVIKMLRYNTGTDKKAFVEFKKYFDAVIFNATIVAYSGSAVADLVSVHKNQYIIDPQTHIMQHDITALMSKSKKTNTFTIKKSVKQYLQQLPNLVTDIIVEKRRQLSINEIESVIDELVEKVYIFETEYVNGFVKNKEYDKYLRYANIGPQPKVVIAPYFMIKKDMESEQLQRYLKLNEVCLQKFVEYQKNSGKHYPVAAQLVMDKEILRDAEIIPKIRSIYDKDGYEYIFIWISDFSTWESSDGEKRNFYELVRMLNEIKKKPIMSYGGYDSILLCHKEMKARLYGTAQSVGYGEARAITPVGGGLPVNKYYFGPLHKRMRFDEALSILMNSGYFDNSKTNANHAKDYYYNICSCKQCKEIIKDDIDNFKIYNESVPYLVNARYGQIKRNRPTTQANLVAAFHFLYKKVEEWKQLDELSIEELVSKLIINYQMYSTQKETDNIKEWCEIFAM